MAKDYDPDSDQDNEVDLGKIVERAQPAQIPLLDDVVFDTALPFPKPRPRLKPPADKNAPRATDLFGGSPETAQSGPLSNHYKAEDVNETTRQVRTRTDRVVEHPLAEYSQEIVERLRDELTAVLQDLKQLPKHDLKQEPTNKPD